MKQKSVLFLSYDGLLDPLGQSQILPYIEDISKHPRKVHVITFEKQDRYRVGGEALRHRLRGEIVWTALRFTSYFGLLGKLWDLIRMYVTAGYIVLIERPQIVHCRSYPSMQVGLLLKRLFNCKLIFDMRGLWVDDKVEGGLWPQSRFIYRLIYKTYKRLERVMLYNSNHIVVLTKRVIPELKRIAPGLDAPITVVPCCADYGHYKYDRCQRRNVRRKLGIRETSPVLVYLGSIGTVYLFDEVLQTFIECSQKVEDLHLLVVSQSWTIALEQRIKTDVDPKLHSRIHFCAASRTEVPSYLSASDVMLNFRKATYSQMACSPTKLAEAFAVGLPVISNKGVGDQDQIIPDVGGGALIDLNMQGDIEIICSVLMNLNERIRDRIRYVTQSRFGREASARLYNEVYISLDCDG